MNVLADLQNWYASNCDEDWEHTYGIKIDTLDNPGWKVTIDLEETNLEGKEFQRFKDYSSEESWIECWVEDMKFHGVGDPEKLEKILESFIGWAKFQDEDWLMPPPAMTEEERQRYEDDRLFASLNDEVERERCQHEECDRNRIRNSVMCREHHFEMITGRAVPQQTS